jgi:hypothetical protein
MTHKIKYGERVGVPLTLADRDLVLRSDLLSEELAERMRAPRVNDGKVRCELTLDELDEVMRSIASEANETDDVDLQEQLDELHDRLAKLEASYVEVDESDQEEEDRRGTRHSFDPS